MVDHEHAQKWAIDCLTRMLCHPSINLTFDEANNAAQCMTLLSGKPYYLRSQQQQAQRRYYVSLVAPNSGGSPTRQRIEHSNRQRGGSI